MSSSHVEPMQANQSEMDFSPIGSHAKHVMDDLSLLLTAEHLPILTDDLRAQVLYFVEAIIRCHKAFVHTIVATRKIETLIAQQEAPEVSNKQITKYVLERLIVAYDNTGDAYKICPDVKASLEMLLAPALLTHGSIIIKLPLANTMRSIINYISVQTLIDNIIHSLNEFALAVQSFMAWLMRFRSLLENEDVVLFLKTGETGSTKHWDPVAIVFYTYDKDLCDLRDAYPAFFPPYTLSTEIGDRVADDFVSRQQHLEVSTPKIRLVSMPENVYPKVDSGDGYVQAGHEFNESTAIGQEFYKAQLSTLERTTPNISHLEFLITFSPAPDKFISSVVVQTKFRPKDTTLDPSVVRVLEVRPKDADDFLDRQFRPTPKPTLRTGSSSLGCIEWHLGRRWTKFFSKPEFPARFHLDLTLEHPVDIVVEIDLIVTHRCGLRRRTHIHPSAFPAIIPAFPEGFI